MHQDDCLCSALLSVTHNSLLNEALVMIRYLICYVHDVNSGKTFPGWGGVASTKCHLVLNYALHGNPGKLKI